MSAKTREARGFAVVMKQEYPTAAGLPALLVEMMRLSRAHARLQERRCNEEVPEGHDARCEERIRKLCAELPGCVPVFSGDPREYTVKLRVPSGRTNDWGATGVCVPQ